MIVLGLTGSLGMGKSTTARLVRGGRRAGARCRRGGARLYEGEAAPAIEAAFPGTTADGKVDRAKLGARVLGDPAALQRLEAIVHPLVRDAERGSWRRRSARGAPVVVLDIPLLFETGGEDRVDAVVVVSAPAGGAARAGAGAARHDRGKSSAMLARQMPDAEKRARADFVVDTRRASTPRAPRCGRSWRKVATMPKRR